MNEYLFAILDLILRYYKFTFTHCCGLALDMFNCNKAKSTKLFEVLVLNLHNEASCFVKTKFCDVNDLF